MQGVRTGLDLLADGNFRRLRGQRVGLVAHPASVDASLRHAADLLAAAPGVCLETIFGPEHGWLGQAQDMQAVAKPARARRRGPRAVSLYGKTAASLRPDPKDLRDLDVLVIDLQDVGSRYYTFQATMLYCLEAAQAAGVRTLVLDRPNPLGGERIEGPGLRRGFESFVGAHNVPIRHGLTIGELARLYQAERNLRRADLEIVPCQGWARAMTFDATGLPWVLPSPNMPTLDTALVYPGQCLIEGTNLSEGRGTTRPFELCGAPWLDGVALAAQLRETAPPGVVFRPAWFKPGFQKWSGQLCGGVQLHPNDRALFQPVRTSLALLAAARELSDNRFRWRTEAYEFVEKPIAIDLLFGSSRERLALEAGAPWQEIAAPWKQEETEFRERRRPLLLYPEVLARKRSS